jgi:hypothetical protein
MKPRRATLLLAALLAAEPACRKLETRQLDAVRALRARVQPRFQPPPDGLLTAAQVDAFVRVRKAAGRRPPADVARELDVDPAELSWVRARIVEAFLALDAKQVADAAYEAYGGALARLRDTRRTTQDAKAAGRLDAEIAAVERERAALRRNDPPTPATRNGAMLAARRAEIERIGP